MDIAIIISLNLFKFCIKFFESVKDYFNLCILLSKLVDNLPEDTEYGPRALPTPTGDGVLHMYHSKIHELACSVSKCSWTTRPQQFTTAFQRRWWFNAFYIPEEFVNCA